MATPTIELKELLERSLGFMKSVEKDTHYGIHYEFERPYGQPEVNATRGWPECTCVMCDVAKYLDGQALLNQEARKEKTDAGR